MEGIDKKEDNENMEAISGSNNNLANAKPFLSLSSGPTVEAQFGRMQIAGLISAEQAGQSENSVPSVPKGGPERIRYLANLGNASAARFRKAGSIDDINVAVEAWTELAQSLPANKPITMKVLHNLSESFKSWIDETGKRPDFGNKCVESNS